MTSDSPPVHRDASQQQRARETRTGSCLECGAPLPLSGDCWTRVHELLEIETRVLPSLDRESALRAHFFAISTYQLQHPFRVTAGTLETLRAGVREMLREAARPVDLLRADIGRTAGREKVRRVADPGDRRHVDPSWPRTWSVTAIDVLAASDASCPDAVVAWARSTIADLEGGRTRAVDRRRPSGRAPHTPTTTPGVRPTTSAQQAVRNPEPDRG